MCVNMGSRLLKVIVLYRPPPSRKNKLTVTQFFEDISHFLGEEVSNIGDVNFHLDNHGDPDTRRFHDLIDMLNRTQHVTTPTHRAGHILEAVITHSDINLIQKVEVSHMISDHNLVICRMAYPKPPPKRVTVNGEEVTVC